MDSLGNVYIPSKIKKKRLVYDLENSVKMVQALDFREYFRWFSILESAWKHIQKA